MVGGVGAGGTFRDLRNLDRFGDCGAHHDVSLVRDEHRALRVDSTATDLFVACGILIALLSRAAPTLANANNRCSVNPNRFTWSSS